MIEKILFTLTLVSGVITIIIGLMSMYLFVFTNLYDLEKIFAYLMIASLIIFITIISEYYSLKDKE